MSSWAVVKMIFTQHWTKNKANSHKSHALGTLIILSKLYRCPRTVQKPQYCTEMSIPYGILTTVKKTQYCTEFWVLNKSLSTVHKSQYCTRSLRNVLSIITMQRWKHAISPKLLKIKEQKVIKTSDRVKRHQKGIDSQKNSENMKVMQRWNSKNLQQGRIHGWTVACCWAEAVMQIN